MTPDGARVDGDALFIERGVLLNFSRHPVRLPDPFTGESRVYPSVEHRFQAMKALYAVGPITVLPHEAHVRIASAAASPYAAKRMGRELRIDADAWDVHSSTRMEEAVTAKFVQNRDAAEALLMTGNLRLVEHRADPVWGDDLDGSGRNLMGTILEAVRHHLRCEGGSEVQIGATGASEETLDGDGNG